MNERDIDIVKRLREIDGFGWQCGKPLKDKGSYLRCGCGCSGPTEDFCGTEVHAPKILWEAADEIERLRDLVNVFHSGLKAARFKADAIEAMGFRWEWSRTVRPDGQQDGGWIEVEPKRGCARDQKTTQFCREALGLQAELATCRIAYEQAIRDRDAARLAYCRDVWQGFGDEDEQRRLTPREIAREKGWPWPIAGSEAAT